MDEDRRRLLKQLGAVAGVSAGAAYVSLAPRNWPFSLSDPDGTRVVEEIKSVRREGQLSAAARDLYEQFRTAPKKARNWAKELEEDARELDYVSARDLAVAADLRGAPGTTRACLRQLRRRLRLRASSTPPFTPDKSAYCVHQRASVARL